MSLYKKYLGKICIVMSLTLAVGILSACGHNQELSGVTEPVETKPVENTGQEFSNPAASTTAALDGSIAEQTFEVELSEYEGMVTFVPYAPTRENPELKMEIRQNDKVLTTITGWVPEELEKETFNSLDAVSFYDVNYDTYTDIVLVTTYGNTTFLAIYSGFDKDVWEYEQHFLVQMGLSEQLSAKLDTVSISELRNFLAEGRKNGEFTSYQEAYRAVAKLWENDDAEGVTYQLIYFDEDDIPELAAGVNGYFVSLYTYHEGTIYTLMDHWGYGAMGNAGYEYAPRQNRLRNYNSDMAGAILYTTYMEIGENYSLDTVAQITSYQFDDVNKNGMVDEEEKDSLGNYSVSYLDGKEIPAQESAKYDMAEFEYITGEMTLEELNDALE